MIESPFETSKILRREKEKKNHIFIFSEFVISFCDSARRCREIFISLIVGLSGLFLPEAHTLHALHIHTISTSHCTVRCFNLHYTRYHTRPKPLPSPFPALHNVTYKKITTHSRAMSLVRPLATRQGDQRSYRSSVTVTKQQRPLQSLQRSPRSVHSHLLSHYNPHHYNREAEQKQC